jgi:hypothetical protein
MIAAPNGAAERRNRRGVAAIEVDATDRIAAAIQQLDGDRALLVRM